MKNELENIHHLKMNNLNFLLVDISYRKPHLHFDMEVAFVLEGSGIAQTQDKEIKLHEGQVIIFNSCQVHELSSQVGMKLLILQFSTNIFELVFPQLDKTYFESQAVNLFDKPDILQLLLKTAKCYFQENYSPLQTYGFISLLLDSLLKVCHYTILKETEQNKLMDLQDRIQHIATYIHENYTDKISLDDLASREGFSRTYFSHFFKNNFGVTFKDYVNTLRCENAATLLATTKENLLSISYACGFADIRTLNNSFAKYYGLLPKDYRNSDLAWRASRSTSYNQDEIDNQTFYSNEASYELIKQFEENIYLKSSVR
ncbi:helix-turn-helix domain-containing protein [Lactococcus nasutitermitis]|uniref:Helix-turn-helix domain-containing protein n=1 Tax=Lactococcus nasutitermitis TaxID=1652957 RepID=A0ABV9JCZ0_9LACT|nr:AraC family transcriptional regulator [Lactococcus nasutitermitis]